ncbi:MAG: hypothetical protein ABSG31_14945 [Tepidisphaeraceae bacterium]|jgi:hypothetical protein
MGREGRLRVGPWPKVHRIPPPQAGTSHIASLQNAASSVAGTASAVRSAGEFTHSSKRPQSARKS